VVKTPEEAEKAAAAMLDKTLVTHQTGPQGREVRRLLIEEGLPIARELYLGMVLDRAVGRVTVIASTEGGVEIEEVARTSPEKIFKEVIDSAVGLLPFQSRRLAYARGPNKQVGPFAALLHALARACGARY